MITSIIISIVVLIVTTMISIIPFIGGLISRFISIAVNIGIFILWLIGIIYAANGEKKKIPIIGEYAEENLKI